MDKEYILKTPVVIGVKEDGSVNETNKLMLRDPTAGDLRGLSFRSLVAETKADEWIVLISRITVPAIPVASLKMMPVNDFAKLMMGALDMLGEGDSRN